MTQQCEKCRTVTPNLSSPCHNCGRVEHVAFKVTGDSGFDPSTEGYRPVTKGWYTLSGGSDMFLLEAGKEYKVAMDENGNLVPVGYLERKRV